MENHELVVFQPYSQGETFPIAFNILKMTATLRKLMHLNAVKVFALEITRSVINSGLSFYVSTAILQTLIKKLSEFFSAKRAEIELRCKSESKNKLKYGF